MSVTMTAKRDITRFAHIPEDLISRPQWVLWRFEIRDGRKTKIPLQLNGCRAKADTPSTWAAYPDALEAYAANKPQSDGIGFVFSADDPFMGIDLDKAINPDRTVKEWAAPIYRQLAPSAYVEISPSGQGLKLWIRGAMPDHKGRVKRGLGDDQQGAIEAYSAKRMFTVTGAHFTEGGK